MNATLLTGKLSNIKVSSIAGIGDELCNHQTINSSSLKKKSTEN